MRTIMIKEEFADGKYTLIFDNAGNFEALRYGDKWRDLVGDGMVLAMLQEVERLREIERNNDNLISCICNLLSEVDAKTLDECSVEELTQLQYWLSKHQGSIFVKTVGRMAGRFNELLDVQKCGVK